MKIPIWTIPVVLSGLFFGNYLFQDMTETPNWNKAFERSFFQFVAIMVYWISLNNLPEKRNENQ